MENGRIGSLLERPQAKVVLEIWVGFERRTWVKHISCSGGSTTRRKNALNRNECVTHKKARPPQATETEMQAMTQNTYILSHT
jgi:hypothetical protein